MSLDVTLTAKRPVKVFEYNITHNLNNMARHAGLYEAIWRPEEIGITTAAQLIAPLREGLAKLEADPEGFARYNPSNGWGDYDNLVDFIRAYLAACEADPDALVTASR